MDIGRVSISYAKALLDWAVSNKIAQEVYLQSQKLLDFVCTNPQFIDMLASPVATIETKYKTSQNILDNIAPYFNATLKLIIKNRRERQLKNILLVFQKIYREKFDIVKVQVESASGLTVENLDSISAFINSNLNKSVEIEHQVNPNLIGGFTITIEDRVMDKSVKGELEQLRQRFMSL